LGKRYICRGVHGEPRPLLRYCRGTSLTEHTPSRQNQNTLGGPPLRSTSSACQRGLDDRILKSLLL
ncbi:hypothetical protein J6590_001073, partial [Homalodisca vitripennis]